MPEHIRYEVGEAAATITLHRPDKLNAYVPAMGDEIVTAFDAAAADENVRAVVLTGAGRAFCAGVDLDYMKGVMSGAIEHDGPPLGQEPFVREWPAAMLDYPKPVIAAINGPAFGVGVTMTLPCDVRIAARGAVLGLNFTKLGMLPGLGSTHLLPQLIGIGNALDVVLTARTLPAERAAEIGLVQEVVAAEELLGCARERARAIAACPPGVTTAAKRALRRGVVSNVDEALAHERQASRALRGER